MAATQCITFLASIPPLQSAVTISGDRGGMRVKLDIPESEMANAVRLLTMREQVLRVSVEVAGDVPPRGLVRTGTREST